jgi:RIO kinase 1
MELDERVLKKVLLKLQRYERESRQLRKRSEEYEVLEEVFDRPTLMTLYDLMNRGLIKMLHGVAGAGKESRLYWGVSPEGRDLAVKIYLTVAKEFRKRLPYIVGDPRFEGLKTGGSRLVEVWAKKEFKNLFQAYRAGVPVPEPLGVKRNVLVMEFIGSEGQPAPLLAQVRVSAKDYRTVIKMVGKLYQEAELVHADLSEFNIFKHEGELILFDFGSAVDITHPQAEAFLARDLANINAFFKKRGVEVLALEEVLRLVKAA